MGVGVLMFFIIEQTFLESQEAWCTLTGLAKWLEYFTSCILRPVLQEENIWFQWNGLGNLMVGFPDEAFAELDNQDPGIAEVFCFVLFCFVNWC